MYSQRTMMGEIFNSPSRPFYQSASTMSLGTIPVEKYTRFAQQHLMEADKQAKRVTHCHL